MLNIVFKNCGIKKINILLFFILLYGNVLKLLSTKKEVVISILMPLNKLKLRVFEYFTFLTNF